MARKTTENYGRLRNASRRKAEEIIAAGGDAQRKSGTEQGTRLIGWRLICVDGVPLKKKERLLYFMLHKPKVM